MKIALVNDSSGNLPALVAILAHMENKGIDLKIHLGNMVGLFPFPNECLRLVEGNFNYILRGKFEECLLSNPLPLTRFERESYDIAAGLIDDDNLEFVPSLESVIPLADQILIAHAGTQDGMFRIDHDDPSVSFYSNVDFRLAFLGRSFAKNEILTQQKDGTIRYQKCPPKQEEVKITLDKSNKHTVHVGSSGAPVDNDPRTGYVVYDTDSSELTFYRIPYSMDRTVGKMQKLGYSSTMCLRVLNGR